MPAPEPTHFERFLCRVQRMPLWQKALLALALLALPLTISSLEGVRAELVNRETWRVAHFGTAAVIYMVAVAPWIRRAEQQVRTLFLSVLTPLFVAIARVFGIYLTEGHF